MLLFQQFWPNVSGYRTRSYFFGSDKVCQSSIQSDNFIESYRVYDLLLLLLPHTDPPSGGKRRDFKKKEKSVILTDMSVDFTGSSVEFTNNL